MGTIIGTDVEIEVGKNYKGKINEIDGNTKQNSYEGNQLVDFPNATNLSRANYTYNNNILTVTTDTSQTGGYNGVNYNITDIVKANPGKVLKFACKSVDLSNFSSTSSTVVQLAVTISGSTTYSILARKESNTSMAYSTYTIPDDTSNLTSFRVLVYTNNASTTAASTTIIEEPMLQFGTDEKDYEPYVGAVAAPNPDYPQEVVSIGSNINLFDKDNFTKKNAYFVNQTVTNVGNRRMLVIPCKPNTTYTIQKRNDGTNNIFQVGTTKEYPDAGVAIFDVRSISNASSITITSNSEAQYFICTYYYTNETKLTEQEVLDSIKIKEGEVATGYSKYGCGSVDYEISTKITADDTTWEVGKYLDINGNEQSNSGWEYSDYIDISNGDYYIHFESSGNAPKHILYNKNKEMIGYMNVAIGDFAIDTNAYYIRVSIGTIAANTLKIYTDTEITIPLSVELCKIGDFKDYLYKVNNKWYKHKEINKYIFDGTETWSVSGAGTENWFYQSGNVLSTNPANVTEAVRQNDLCNRYTYAPVTTGNTNQGFWVLANQIRIRYGTEDTASNFRTWLSNNNAILYYVLETPVEEEITDLDTIEALEKVQNIILYEGKNYISNLNDPQSTFELEYDKIAAFYDFYISADGYFISSKENIKNLINPYESNIPSMAEATQASVRIAGTDGDIPLMTTYEPIPFNIVCYTEDNLTPEEKIEEENKINKLLNRLKNGIGKFAFEDQEKFYEVKYNGLLTTTRYPKHIKFAIPLKSSKSFSKYFIESSVEGNATFESNTVKETGGIFTIIGPATAPKIYLNGYEMYYNANLSSGDRLVIDSNNSTITLIAANGTKTNVMRYYNHQFPKIENGTNELLIYSGVSASQVSLKWYDLKF